MTEQLCKCGHPASQHSPTGEGPCIATVPDPERKGEYVACECNKFESAANTEWSPEQFANNQDDRARIEQTIAENITERESLAPAFDYYAGIALRMALGESIDRFGIRDHQFVKDVAGRCAVVADGMVKARERWVLDNGGKLFEDEQQDKGGFMLQGYTLKEFLKQGLVEDDGEGGYRLTKCVDTDTPKE